MKRFIIFFILLILSSLCHSYGQNEKIDSLFNKFLYYNGIGNLMQSQSVLLEILHTNINIPEWYKAAINNNLCMINISMGLYDHALEFNKIAEEQLLDQKIEDQTLADIYLNRAYIYDIKKSYSYSITYFEKAIRIYQSLKSTKDRSFYQNLSAAYLNIGIVYYELGNYTVAEEYFKKSTLLKTKYDLTRLALVYLNIAKTHVKKNELSLAEKYYNKSISTFINDYGSNYYRLADVFFDYGIFLRSEHRSDEAMKIHRKALYICLENYGRKHTFTSLAYKHQC